MDEDALAEMLESPWLVAGVAFAGSVLVGDALASGRLIKPFDISLPAQYAYFLVCPPANLNRPKVKVFRTWLLDEAKTPNEAACHGA